MSEKTFTLINICIHLLWFWDPAVGTVIDILAWLQSSGWILSIIKQQLFWTLVFHLSILFLPFFQVLEQRRYMLFTGNYLETPALGILTIIMNTKNKAFKIRG